MRAVALVLDGLFRFFHRLILTPFLLGWLALWLILGMAIGSLVATPLVFGIFRHWLESSGAETFFGGLGRDSHGSARFAGKNELRKLEAADGLLIGRNPKTGRLLRYDGPAHLLTLAPTRAGKGVGTVIPNLLAAEAASVLSNAQRHTHFLDSPRIARVMARSDFHFADLRHRITSVFLVLPPNRLDAYSRWLRLLVSQALQDIARDAERPAQAVGASPALSEALRAPLSATGRLKAPTLFLLDEFAALGRLEAVERAMGLMAGYGLQLWPILQDMSQLRDLYGARASTFIANAGVQQVFGVNDFETAKWLSQTMGQETIGYRTESHKPGDMPTTGTSITGRDLLTPDEIMQLPPHLQLLRVQGQPTAMVQKLRYYADREFDGLFVPQDA